jgi:hypothetical protein
MDIINVKAGGTCGIHCVFTQEEASIRTPEHSLGTTFYESLYVSDENTHDRSASYSQLLAGRARKLVV